MHDAERHDLAELHYRRAIELRPGSALAQAGLGTVLLEVGDIPGARTCAEHAIALEPGRPSHYLLWARATKVEAGHPILSAMLSLRDALKSLDDPQKVDLHFALAKGFSDIGENLRSFEHQIEGNALKRRTIHYNESANLAAMQRMQKMFSSGFMQKFRGIGSRSSQPIFIVGMPRSGSSLVEQILASHPAVWGGGESRAFREAGNASGIFLAGMSPPQVTDDLSELHIEKFSTRYIDIMNDHAGRLGNKNNRDRITDKMLENFRYLGFINISFPNAKIIHMNRDPIDLCLSCFSINFKSLHFTYDLGELGRQYAAYRQLMAHWRAVLPPGVMLDVSHDMLIKDPEGQSRNIIAHCGLQWDDACLRFNETARVVRTASATQVRQPIYQGAARRWRPDAELLNPLIEGLKYEFRGTVDTDLDG